MKILNWNNTSKGKAMRFDERQQDITIVPDDLFTNPDEGTVWFKYNNRYKDLIVGGNDNLMVRVKDIYPYDDVYEVVEIIND